jgi:tetratricopeptide (TPR) repeat protein
MMEQSTPQLEREAKASEETTRRVFVVEYPGRRLCWGALAAVTVCFVVLFLRHVIRPDPCVGINLLVLTVTAGLAAAGILFFAFILPDTNVLRAFWTVPLIAGVFAGMLSADHNLPFEPGALGSRFAMERLLAEATGTLFEEWGRPGVAAQFARLPYVRPVMLGFTVALSMAMCVLAIRLKTKRPLIAKVAIYAAGTALLFLGRAVIRPIIVVDWPAMSDLGSAWGTGLWLSLPLLALAADLGQQLGRSELVGRHGGKMLVGFTGGLLLLAGICWRPITAEYCFWRGLSLIVSEGDNAVEQRSTGRIALEKAYQLQPNNGRNAYMYASSVLQNQAWSLVHKKEYDRALEHMDRALNVFPKDPSLQTTLAIIHRRMGNNAKALVHSRRALDLCNSVDAEQCRRCMMLGLSALQCERRLIDALGHEGSPASINEVRGYLKRSEAELLVRAAAVLAKKGLHDEATPVLEAALKSGDSSTRREARKALETIKAKQEKKK